MDGQLFLDYMDIVLRSEKVGTSPATLKDTVKNDYEAWELGDVAACEFAKLTLLLRREETITSIDGTRDYNCPPDFIKVVRKAVDGRTDVIRYTQAGLTQGELIYRGAYNDAFTNDTAQEEGIPSSFDIIEAPLAPAEITGVATAAGNVAGGEAVLTAAASLFTTTGLTYARNRIRNTTTGKSNRGVVLAVTDATHLRTVMFKDGATQSWGNGDTFAIQSSSKFKLRFPYALSTSGDAILLDYTCFPPPVYSPTGMWGFPDPSHIMACAVYAVWWLRMRNLPQQPAGEVNVAALTSDRLYNVFQNFVDTAIADKRRRMMTLEPSALMGVM
jgi:hypothetical protein